MEAGPPTPDESGSSAGIRVLMIADWTARDEAITKLLHQFGRDGVPLYVFYPAYGEPTLLPQILTPEIVIERLSAFFKLIG